MTPAEIMRDLARDDIFPKDAMAAASVDREVMLPVFLDMIDRLVSRQIASGHGNDVMALIPVFHLLGEWQDPRAYRPVVRLMRLPTETIEHLLGDAITETGFRLVAGTYDGDLQPIFEAIHDDEADEYARSSMMSALVLITQLHPSQRPDIEEFFRAFHKHCAKAPADLVIGWMDAIAELGLEDMSAAVREVFDNHLIPDDYCDFAHFEADLQATLDRGGEPDTDPHRKSLITNAIEELSKWHCYSDEFLKEQRTHKVSNDLRVAPWTEALLKPPAKPGRNDPCPCGSGKKFKKCCLQ